MMLAYKFLIFCPDCLSSRHNVNFEVTSITIMRKCSHTYTCRPQFLRRPFEKGAHLSLFPYARGPSNKFVRVIVPPLCATVLALCPDLIRQTECVQQHLAGMLTHDSTPCLSGSIGNSFLNITIFNLDYTELLPRVHTQAHVISKIRLTPTLIWVSFPNSQNAVAKENTVPRAPLTFCR